MATMLASITEECRLSKVSCTPLEYAMDAPPMLTIGPIRLEDMIVPEETPIFHWDLRDISAPVLPALQYISKKLVQQDIHIALIVTSHTPELIPVWPINAHAQNFLSKLVRKASRRYDISPLWLKSLNDVCRILPPGNAFEGHRTMSYLIHRSLVQHNVIFSGAGLTLLAVDSIYLFKSLVKNLSETDWVPLSRMQCRDSCVNLLHHVHSVYTGTKLSKGYLKRAYQHIKLDETALSEVCEAYRQTYGKPGLAEMSQREGSKERSWPIKTSLPNSKKTDFECMTSRRATESGVITSRKPKSASSNRLITPGDLPKLTTENLNIIAVESESPESFYLDSIDGALGRSSNFKSLSAGPSERARSFEHVKKQLQSARPRSNSRARLFDPSPTISLSPLGIIDLPRDTPVTVIERHTPLATSSWMPITGPPSDASSSNAPQTKVPRTLRSTSSFSSASSPRFSSASSSFSERSSVGLPRNPRDTPLLNMRNVQSDLVCSRCKIAVASSPPLPHEERSRFDWQSLIKPSAPRQIVSHDSILFGERD